ncbi:MAG: 5'-nucleotidase, lipoprotein e(P4) family, partial [Selenomonas sp.]|nr:5'-nucleotidase, lipoprotein e(P4) family [Selenomonas sp.]
EYRELCYQAYNVALFQVKQAVAQHKQGAKPLAIVLDADETVLDNSAFEAGLIDTDSAYSTKSWNEWCAAGEALAMPGATDFLQAVDKLGVQIFYVTNRSMDTQYEGSARNMKQLGFPQVDKEHMVFKTTTSDKQPRYDAIEAKYDVVVYLGDNAGDLPLGTYHKKQMMRNAIIDANKDKFGMKYIALPNPSYGDWEPAQYNDGDGNYWALTPKQKREARKKALRTWVAPTEKKRMKAEATEHSLVDQVKAEEAAIEKAHGLPAGAIANDIHN